MGAKDATLVKLYLRLPVQIVDEQQIKDLHPGIVKVVLPRQKSRRWCFVNVEYTGDAVKELKSIKIEGKPLRVKWTKTKNSVARKEFS